MRDGDGQIFYLDFPIPDYNNEFIRLACSNYVHEITPELTDCVHEYIQDNVHWALFNRWDSFNPRHYDFIQNLEKHHGVVLANRDYAYHERDAKDSFNRFRPFGISRKSEYIGANHGAMSYVKPDMHITLEHVALESYIVKTFFEHAKEQYGYVLDSTVPHRFVSACQAAMHNLCFKVDVSHRELRDVEDRVLRSTGRVIGGTPITVGHEFVFTRESHPSQRHPKIIIACSHDFSQADVHLDLPNLGRLPGGTWCIPGVDFFLPKSVCVRLN